MTVGTTATKVQGKDLLIQNLGAGDLYLGVNDSDLTTEGVKLAAGVSYGAVGYQIIYMVASEADTDVRVLEA